MVRLDDIKVLGANTMCMVLAKIQDMNDTLQSVLFFATIAYTVVRTVNEINKFKKDGKADINNDQG
jgi:hypothetical protein